MCLLRRCGLREWATCVEVQSVGVTGDSAQVADEAEDGQRGMKRGRLWLAIGTAAAFVALGVLAKGVFVATTTTIVINSQTDTASGRVEWGGHTCVTHKPTGILVGNDSYVTEAAMQYRPFKGTELPAGNKVRRTRRWFQPDHYVFLADDGEVIPLYQLHRFWQVSCP